MPQRQAITAIVIGLAFIAFGLVPGSVAHLKNEIRHFSDSLSHDRTPQSYHLTQNKERVPGQIWWAIGGLALVTLGLLTFLLN